MDSPCLHIVSLDIPYPPLRGNVSGIYHRIRSLKEAGVEVILHAFYKKFSLPDELTKYCRTIYLYPRKAMWKITGLRLPLFVQSRRSAQLLDMLCQDKHPILFEGLHCLYHFEDPRLADRKKFIRMHNIESLYYGHLGRTETHLLRKGYFRFESSRSKSLEEKGLPKATGVFAISQAEHHYLSIRNIPSVWIPPFHPHREAGGKAGFGEYALYHGDLSIRENEEAAVFLIRQVFSKLDYPLVIAGFRPGIKLKREMEGRQQITLIDSPSTVQMREILEKAHIHLLPFSQNNGFKMKILDSLAFGRHILSNTLIGEANPELAGCLHLAGPSAPEWIEKIKTLSQQAYLPEESDKRQNLFDSIYNNAISVKKILNAIYPG
ncbi:MAG TPA: glycosyltransferase family 4 protein [Saprospiraceae bacterium]|nr:glycosyltransferase family 4 protein [Saprospiraceae bacterium]